MVQEKSRHFAEKQAVLQHDGIYGTIADPHF
jgi:hypothetical protein